MTPLIKSGQLVTVEPFKALPALNQIVLCKVRGAQYLHLISAIEHNFDQKTGLTGRVMISNNRGHDNGWTSVKNIYGIVTKIED